MNPVHPTSGGVIALTCQLAGFAPAVAAQSPPPEAAPRPEARAVRISGPSPEIDGRLHEAVWEQAVMMTGFRQKIPDEAAPASERTEVRILYDDAALYVGVRLYSQDPASIQAPMGRRDQAGEADQFLVSLDTWQDRRTAYTFGVTAAGVRLDSHHPADAEEVQDASFDPVWEARTRIDSLGWTAEMRIPFSQLRFNKGARQHWGINGKRVIPARNEESYWVQVPRSVTAWASRFGDLTGLEGIRSPRRIELTPYAATGLSVASTPQEGNPFAGGSDPTGRAGADLKAGLGPNLTFQSTVNPDFGQVELDPADVNLTVFETFFPERRPFFVEGSHLLESGGAGYFYSRRIGAPPRGAAPGTFADRPDHTTIAGAAKVTGRLASGLSVGALTALTAREHARTFDAETRAFGRVEVEPLTAYGVGRLQQQFGQFGSTAGVIVTGVRRDVRPGEPLARLLNREAVTGAADWNLRLGGGEYALRGNLGFSHVEGDSAAILRQQLSSARYFQRPDASHVDVRSGRTSLAGVAGGLGLARISGRHWLWEASVDFGSPGFELNDAGRMGSSDDVVGFAALRYRENRPGPRLRSYQVGLSSQNAWNFERVRTFSTVRAEAAATWRNFWTSSVMVLADPPSHSDVLTRGGPLMRTAFQWAVIGQAANPATAPTRWNARVYYGGADEGGPTYRFSGGVSIRPGPRWQLSLEPNYVYFGIPRQYVGARPDGPASTYGTRYVFSHLGLTEFRLRARLNYAFRPELTLETSVEPYASSAHFSRFGELVAARSGELRRYGTDGTMLEQTDDRSFRVTDRGAVFSLPYSDFNVRSLRGNTVLRWEWARGSTLFVVWQQNRFRQYPGGELIRPWSVGQALRADGTNLLAAKLTYWLDI